MTQYYFMEDAPRLTLLVALSKESDALPKP